MRLAASQDGKNISRPKIIPTPQNFSAAIAEFKTMAAELSNGAKITAVAGGIAGPLDDTKSMILNAHNLPDWNLKPFKKEIEKTVKAPVVIENDAAVFGLGEATRGAGTGKKIVAYITVSTGVGGSRIVNGAIDNRAVSFEPGQQLIDPQKTLCPECVGAGTLENLVSGGALKKRFGKSPVEIKDAQIWEQLAEWLAYGLNNTIVHWSPDILILGGPMLWGKPAISLERVRFHLKNILKIFPELPEIKASQLKDLGGLYGALELLK